MCTSYFTLARNDMFVFFLLMLIFFPRPLSLSLSLSELEEVEEIWQGKLYSIPHFQNFFFSSCLASAYRFFKMKLLPVRFFSEIFLSLMILDY